MLLWILGSFVMCEAVVGVTLTVLLLLGRANPTLVVDTLSFIGFAILAFGLLPLLSRFRKHVAPKPEEASPQPEDETRPEVGSRLRTFAGQNAHFFRAILVGGFVMAMAFGLYFIPGIS